MQESTGEWQAAIRLFEELQSSRLSADSAQSCDILNRVLVEAGEWQRCLCVMDVMLDQRMIPNGMHIASTASVLKSELSSQLLQDALLLWRANGKILEPPSPFPGLLACQPGVVAVSKPPDRSTEDLLEELSALQPNSFSSVSRLDYPTSGVLIVAHGPSGSPAVNWLQAQFASRHVKKTYLCLVEGASLGPEGCQGQVRKPLLTTEERVEVSNLGLEALTFYKVLQEFSHDGAEFSYLQVMPKTGRMHQIRVHLASIGRPLVTRPCRYAATISCDEVGDLTYNPQPRVPELSARLFLHCHRMDLQDLNRERFWAEEPLPRDLQKTLTFLRNNRQNDLTGSREFGR